MRDYVSSRVGKVSNATIRRGLSALSRLLAACCAWGWRLDNPARAYDRSIIKERHEPIHPPSRQDLEKFLSACPPAMAQIVRLLDATGMREEEAVQMERWQVNTERKQIVLTRTKTSRPRVTPWSTAAGDATLILAAATRSHLAAISDSRPAARVGDPGAQGWDVDLPGEPDARA